MVDELAWPGWKKPGWRARMSSKGQHPTLTFASLNVNGLRDRGKRLALFSGLRGRVDGVDVLMLRKPTMAPCSKWMIGYMRGVGLVDRGRGGRHGVLVQVHLVVLLCW